MLNKKRMVTYDYSKLRIRIREMYGTEANFAKDLGISCAQLSAKLNGDCSFRQPQIEKSIKLLKISGDELTTLFFSRK